MAVTPMMEQYNQFKKQYPEKIVLFRMGDFFETFGDDAKLTAKILNITLTARDRSSDPTPLAGFPHHALNQYLPKIIDAGYSAVIVDQIEDPKFAKGIVKRAVTRIVTASTIDNNLESIPKPLTLGSFYTSKKNIYACFLDVSTGSITYTSTTNEKGSLNNLLGTMDPVEALILESEKELVFPNIPVGLVSKSFKNIQYSVEKIKEIYTVANVQSLGLAPEEEFVVPIAMALDYVLETQKVKPEHLQKPKRINLSNTMVLDRATVSNLELVFSSSKGLNGSLFNVLDQTKTLMGKRMLYTWILNPLIDVKQIQKRLDITQYLVDNSEIHNAVRDSLDGMNDISRLVGKIGMNRANARDIKALQLSLSRVLMLKEVLGSISSEFKGLDNPEYLKKVKEVVDMLEKSIEDSPPLLITEGHIIKIGYNKEVDQLRTLSGDVKGWIKEFEESEKIRTGIGSLKIGYTKVFGYYIEITNAHKSKVPTDYIRKQTLVNAERYITEKLKEQEELILTSHEKLATLEFGIFQEIRNICLPYIPILQSISEDIAMLDVLAGFGYLAIFKNYTRPKIHGFGEEKGTLSIRGGRHPIVEQYVEDGFVSNDTLLDMGENRMAILTGPNMSGKSTYIRQVATITLMAQIGCFVPATKASISICDRIFTRVGASDDLSGGRSTFMVEMDEAANIVNNASKYSLVILDEIGRGTSTYDGVSIAWSLAEYLTTVVKARTIFATHYHELLKLPQKIGSGVKNYNVLVDEDTQKGTVVFLRKIVEGGTDRSYGIYVAQMAGLPEKVIARAKEILEGFEQESLFSMDTKLRDVNISQTNDLAIKNVQIPLFEIKEDEIRKELSEVDIDNLTPLQALNLIGKLKKKL